MSFGALSNKQRRPLVKMTVEEWKAEGQRRFGLPARKWKFVCPSCGTVQSGEDLLEAGIKLDDVERYLAFSCIGRFTSAKGCDWTLGGLFQLHELALVHEGKELPRFRFADESEVAS